MRAEFRSTLNSDRNLYLINKDLSQFQSQDEYLSATEETPLHSNNESFASAVDATNEQVEGVVDEDVEPVVDADVEPVVDEDVEPVVDEDVEAAVDEDVEDAVDENVEAAAEIVPAAPTPHPPPQDLQAQAWREQGAIPRMRTQRIVEERFESFEVRNLDWRLSKCRRL